MGGVGSVCTELTVWEGKTMKTAVKHCVSSAYQIGTGGGVEGRRGLAPPPIRLRNTGRNLCTVQTAHIECTRGASAKNKADFPFAQHLVKEPEAVH